MDQHEACMHVGLGPGQIVLDGDPPRLPQRGGAPQFSAHICCDQMTGWIKVALGMEVGIGPGDFVLDGDPAPPPRKGGSEFLAHVYCGQTAGRIKMALSMEVGVDPSDIMLDGDPAPLPKGRGQSSPILGPCVGLLWPKGCMDQDETWHGVRPRAWPHCVRRKPSSFPQKVGGAPNPNFRPMSIVPKRMDGSRFHLALR